MRGQRLRFAIFLLALAFMAAATFWLHAQSADSRPISSLLPPGALIYLEAKDFGSLLNQWGSSAEKKNAGSPAPITV